MQVAGSVAFVTGGASGLGKATAEALAAGGATVVICDLPTAPGAEVAEQLGGKSTFAPADVTSEDDVERALDTAVGLGPLRVVVNCAGIGTPGRILSKGRPLPLDQFRKVIDVNLIGTFNVTRLAAARMLDVDLDGEERGVIICTASVAAFEGQIGQAAYAASKAGVHGLTICLARDLADKAIRVVTIAPGVFKTPMVAGLSEQVQESLGQQVPHPARLGRPEEYAKLAMSIVDNPMLNGETIRLDGAIRMAPR
ncbi:MAG: SDR family NAD(P)-dependent oxidoreductase [Streptosporangiales bacterium]|nr:SDR family NAD(P)-dependent oxidoreductase [Streptosporangiales bacterium]